MAGMLLARAFAGFVFLFAVVAAVFFGSAGTLDDGRAWLMMAVFFGCAAHITVWLWFRDKALLERRVKAGPGSEPDPMQNVVQALAGFVFLQPSPCRGSTSASAGPTSPSPSPSRAMR